jgi:hypothetical protein
MYQVKENFCHPALCTNPEIVSLEIDDEEERNNPPHNT